MKNYKSNVDFSFSAFAISAYVQRGNLIKLWRQTARRLSLISPPNNFIRIFHSSPDLIHHSLSFSFFNRRPLCIHCPFHPTPPFDSAYYCNHAEIFVFMYFGANEKLSRSGNHNVDEYCYSFSLSLGCLRICWCME